ncbi:hypothetical protein A1D25_03320 [Ursidibacter arcticus]|uniref:DUF5339 domain-containing protein n=1 Tax=Ursidibacter arcticus TaxID=1524965 RepID=UPI0012F84D53|nr:DUF5339 domain-containing protein [Ursidibacter arcticus]KAE9536572.1 hypothetical protein A1D25_03320 [Ursidibacter arcticus]
MKKLLILLSTVILAETALASEVKTSSLSMAKVAPSNQLAQQCQKLFSEGDKLIAEAEKQPGTHTSQVKKLKEKLQSSKQQIVKLDIPTQQKSCDKGLVALNSIKKRY